MVRLMIRFEVVYGRFAEFVRNVEALNGVIRERGWVEFALLVPAASGKFNEAVLAADYPDFAAFASERNAAFADVDWMQAWRANGQLVAQGSGTIEVLEPLPPFAS